MLRRNRIGRRAAELVADGDALLLDASSTVYHMAQYLRDRRGLRIVTNGIEVASLLAQNPTNTVNLVGGILRSGIESLVGPWSERYIQDVRIKTAFVSCSGFTPEGGMTEVDVYEADFRLKAVAGASQVIALIDASKFGKLDLTPSVRMERTGLVKVYCNIHPEMASSIVVLDNPWFALTDRTGQFVICGVPDGAYVLRAWNDMGAEARTPITIDGGRVLATELELRETRRSLAHDDKHGNPYRTRGYR